jgi:hypothetical protein
MNSYIYETIYTSSMCFIFKRILYTPKWARFTKVESFGKYTLIFYIKERNIKALYWEFLNNHHDIIVTSTSTNFSEDWKDLDNCWIVRFLHVGKDLPGFKDKVRFFLFCFCFAKWITP